MRNEGVSQATHKETEKGVRLQNYPYLSCYLFYTTKLNSKIKLRHMPIIYLLHMQIIKFAYS